MPRWSRPFARALSGALLLGIALSACGAAKRPAARAAAPRILCIAGGSEAVKAGISRALAGQGGRAGSYRLSLCPGNPDPVYQPATIAYVGTGESATETVVLADARIAHLTTGTGPDPATGDLSALFRLRPSAAAWTAAEHLARSQPTCTYVLTVPPPGRRPPLRAGDCLLTFTLTAREAGYVAARLVVEAVRSAGASADNRVAVDHALHAVRADVPPAGGVSFAPGGYLATARFVVSRPDLAGRAFIPSSSFQVG